MKSKIGNTVPKRRAAFNICENKRNKDSRTLIQYKKTVKCANEIAEICNLILYEFGTLELHKFFEGALYLQRGP